MSCPALPPAPVAARTPNASRTFPPSRPRQQDPRRGKPSSAANCNDGHQAVALTGGRCSSAHIRRYNSGNRSRTGDAGGGLSIPPNRLGCPLADISHSVISALHPCAPDPSLRSALTRAISPARGRHNGAFYAQRPLNESRRVASGGTSRLMHGYVYDDNAHSISFLEWCDGDHPHSATFPTTSLGAFHEGSDAHYRNAFSIEWRPGHAPPMGLHGTGPNPRRIPAAGASAPRPAHRPPLARRRPHRARPSAHRGRRSPAQAWIAVNLNPGARLWSGWKQRRRHEGPGTPLRPATRHRLPAYYAQPPPPPPPSPQPPTSPAG